MRTTVRLPDGLLEEAKREARLRGTTLTDLIESGLRRELANGRQPGPRPRVMLPKFGRTGPPAPGLDLNSNASIEAFLDEELGLEKRG